MADLPEDSTLRTRMQKLRITEEDLEESFIRGSGAGGQKINKTSSTVVLRHIPERHRGALPARAFPIAEPPDRPPGTLRPAGDDFSKVKLDAQNEREKKRRQTRARPRGLKRRFVAGKRHRAGIKEGRGKVGGEE
jgi:hypothetical protein